jgi:hypothetical protein
VDLFVLRDVDYGEFVEVFIPVLSSVAGNFGYAAYNEREVLFPTREVGFYRRMNYIHFTGLRVQLLIVEGNENIADMKDLTDSFHISVCKTIYYPFTGLVHADLATFWDVWFGRARIPEDKLTFSEMPLSMLQVNRMSSTIKRVTRACR